MSMEDEVKAVATDIERHRQEGKLGVNARDAHINRSLDGLLDLALTMARTLDRMEVRLRRLEHRD